MGVNLGTIGGCNERPDLVRGAVERSRLSVGGTMEEIDEGPAQVLGVRLKRGPGDQCEEIGPDRFERLDNGIAHRKIGC